VFISALGSAAPSPGLTLLLMHLEEMIALNFPLFADEEYAQLPTAIASVRQIIRTLRNDQADWHERVKYQVHVLREVRVV